MRFGKKLALAMIRDLDEAPYISQKNLKHILVGLEKLCKAYADQVVILLDQSLTSTELLLHVNMERAKFGLPQRNSLLEETEIISHDAEFFNQLDRDVEAIRKYVERSEALLMLAVNEWLETKSRYTLVPTELADLARNPVEFSKWLLPSPANEFSIETLRNEMERIVQYIEVNKAAMRKLISRRMKNVPETFWSTNEYPNIESLCSPETSILIDTIDAIERSGRTAAAQERTILLSESSFKS